MKMKNKLITFSNFEKVKDYIISIRSNKMLHSITEANLKILLNEIFPDAHPISEANVNGGRIDLIYYIPPLNESIHFEIFATESQVINDLRLLEQSKSKIKISILIDKEIDLNVSEKYFKKRPSNPFPSINLSNLFLESKVINFKNELAKILDNSFLNNNIKLNNIFTPLREEYLKTRKNKLSISKLKFVKPFVCKFKSFIT